LIAEALEQQGMRVIRLRDVDIDNSAIRPAAVRHQQMECAIKWSMLNDNAEWDFGLQL
jgi:hypothetical protein